jgi:hypothetical protein
MAKVVYVLYEGDAWLSSRSLVPMGIFDNTDDLMASARELISERYSDEDEVEDMMLELGNYNQLSGYDVNYLIKVVELNKLEEF